MEYMRSCSEISINKKALGLETQKGYAAGPYSIVKTILSSDIASSILYHEH